MIETVYDKYSLKDGYILDQEALGKDRYGLLGTGSDNGCGAIAAYNACVKLGIPYRFKDIYQYFSKSGTFLFGLLGTNPLSVIKFFKNITPGEVRVYSNLNKIKKHRAYILLCFGFARNNKKKIVLRGHYQFIEKSDAGLWYLYNPGTVKINSLEQYIDNEIIPHLGSHLVIGLGTVE